MQPTDTRRAHHEVESDRTWRGEVEADRQNGTRVVWISSSTISWRCRASKHMTGEASDNYAKTNLRKLYEWAIQHDPVGGCEYYEDQRFVHTDIRPKARPSDPPVHWEGH